MENEQLLKMPGYDPNRLIDSLLEVMNLKNDAALSHRLEVGAAVISKLRHKRVPVGAGMLINMHEESGLSIRELRTLMGDRRKFFSNGKGSGRRRAQEQE